MTTLGDLATVVRSKNAGPFRVTFDIFFDDEDEDEDYRRAVDSDVTDAQSIADAFGLPEEDVVGIYAVDRISAIKITLRRKVPSGNPADTDVYGAQQHTPLLKFEI